MATLTVRNLDADLVKRLRLRAAEHGRSAEAEHREILRTTLLGSGQSIAQADIVARLAAFRERTGSCGSPSSSELLADSRRDGSERLSPGVAQGS